MHAYLDCLCSLALKTATVVLFENEPLLSFRFGALVVIFSVESDLRLKRLVIILKATQCRI
jgi:hypothetical protein